MKLFWKVFFTTMLVSVTCLAVGGYILITSNLRASLDSEQQLACDYGDMVYYSLSNALQNADAVDALSAIEQVASSININSRRQAIPFGVIAEDGTELYSSLPARLDRQMIESLSGEERGWMLQKNGEETYLQVLRPAQYMGVLFYIETQRDVSYIYNGQKSQYETLFKLMAGMLPVAGLITLAICRLLLRRIVSLSRVTKKISGGSLQERATVAGSDEITALAADFNRMADELEGKICDLQEEAARKERFVGAFSHELKTPLTSIIGYSDMLRQKLTEQEQLSLCANYIFSEGKRLEHISMRLLELTVQKNQEFHPVSVEIAAFTEEICDALTPQLAARGIALSCKLAPASIALEPDLIKTVFLNLIDNARKAIDGSGQIRILGVRQPDAYTVTFSDTGKGMAQEELARITEAFYMIDKSRSRRQGGAGLGLAICDEILKLHGFTLAFDSVVGAGTSVTITMKAADDGK